MKEDGNGTFYQALYGHFDEMLFEHVEVHLIGTFWYGIRTALPRVALQDLCRSLKSVQPSQLSHRPHPALIRLRPARLHVDDKFASGLNVSASRRQDSGLWFTDDS